MVYSKTLFTFAACLLLTVVTLYIINTLNISYPLSIVTTSKTDLSVVGEAKVTVIPDTGVIDAGVIAQGTTADEVKEKINSIHNEITEALSGFGIKKEDIKTSQYSINPVYDQNPNKISGYSGATTVSITVKNITQAGEIIELVTKSGANTVYGPRFSIDNPEKFREEARERAIQNAKEQAEKLAKRLGIKLGKVRNFSESGTPNAPILYRGETMNAADKAIDIEPGSQTVTSTVTLYFEVD